MKIISLYNKYISATEKLQDIALLLLRAILAYGFYGPAMMKLKDIHAIGDWFKELGMPLPYANAYMAIFTELSGFVLIALGLGTRIIAIPMIVVMLVAIKTVHWANGFEAGNNGFEIPLYYLLMLITLIAFGAGKFSLDHLIKIKREK
ncbi:putative oxidoreductase MhqP [mine drainage metagenome]|uniref:Putative oxidoreductase MhqP n=1 Tax=mine drainage metagenome TaxID=410659 RepID=A0A1J5SU96_9ZZZZ